MIKNSIMFQLRDPVLIFPSDWSFQKTLDWRKERGITGSPTSVSDLHFAVWMDDPLSPPSSDNKTPTAATGEAENGTPEFHCGDRVGFSVDVTPYLTNPVQGVILSIEKDGVAQIQAEGGSPFFRHISILKNLSRP